MDLLIAFLVGVAATVMVALITVLITLRVRDSLDGRNDSGSNGKQRKKTRRGKGDGANVTLDEQEGEYTIRFRDAGSSGKTWTCQINEELIIGRGEDCDIQLTDKSVSRPHCKIFIGENGLEAADLGAKHRTRINDVFVYSGSPLKRGDKLRLGREVLLVESIRHLGREEPVRKRPDDDTSDAANETDAEEQMPRRKKSRKSSDTVPASPWNEAHANRWDADDDRQSEARAQEEQRRERSQPVRDSSDTKGVW